MKNAKITNRENQERTQLLRVRQPVDSAISYVVKKRHEIAIRQLAEDGSKTIMQTFLPARWEQAGR